jgi:hypothetical protein
LAGLRRVTSGLLQPWRQDGHEPAGEQRGQLVAGEEMDGQAWLGAGEVADGEAAVVVMLGHLVPGPDVGGGGVDPQAEQAARTQALLGCAYVPVGGGAVTVLEDLDADDQGEGGRGWQAAEVRVDEAGAAVRPLPQPIYMPLVRPACRAAASMSAVKAAGGSPTYRAAAYSASHAAAAGEGPGRSTSAQATGRWPGPARLPEADRAPVPGLPGASDHASLRGPSRRPAPRAARRAARKRSLGLQDH